MLLLVASQAAYALARNLRFSDVLLLRATGPGPGLEAVSFAAGCFYPGDCRSAAAAGVPVGRALFGISGSGISAWAAASAGTPPSTMAIASPWAMTAAALGT